MEESTEQPSLVNHAVKWGIILGAVSVVMTMLLYVVDYTILVLIKYLLVVLALNIGVVIYAGIDYRRSLGGYLAYGKAWKHGAIVFVLATAISVVFGSLLYFVIDTELPQKLTDAAIENQRAMMEGFGAPADAIEQGIQEAKERAKDQYTAVGMLKGFGIFSIFWLVIALLTSLITRKNEPIEM